MIFRGILGRVALHIAAAYGHTEVVKHIVERGKQLADEQKDDMDVEKEDKKEEKKEEEEETDFSNLKSIIEHKKQKEKEELEKLGIKKRGYQFNVV